METQVGLKMIALTLFLNLFFYFLLQLLCVMISHWLTVLKHKIQGQSLTSLPGPGTAAWRCWAPKAPPGRRREVG